MYGRQQKTMPNLQHLPLPRADYDLPRKKKRGFGTPPSRPYGPHGRLLTRQVDDVLTQFRRRSRPAGIDPSLILRIRLDPHATIDEETWERSGLVLLSIDENKTLVLFSSDEELSAFRSRLSEYQQGPTDPDQRSAPYTGIFACIDDIAEVEPKDRIGRLFRREGLQEPDGFLDRSQYTVDIELWDFGSDQMNRNRLEALRTFIQTENGRVTDE